MHVNYVQAPFLCALPIVLKVEKFQRASKPVEGILLDFRDVVGLEVKLAEAVHPLQSLRWDLVHVVVTHFQPFQFLCGVKQSDMSGFVFPSKTHFSPRAKCL